MTHVCPSSDGTWGGTYFRTVQCYAVGIHGMICTLELLRSKGRYTKKKCNVSYVYI